jgi:hypothetical protein
MRIHNLVEFQITDEGLDFLREEGFEYDGPLELCDRNQAHQVANQGMAQSAQDATNAQNANAATNTAVGQYSQRLADFMRYGRQTYGANGEYMRDQNTIANTTAAAATKGAEGDMALNSMRTGENTAGYAAADQEARRQSERDVTSQLATADASRLKELTAINQYGVQASQFPAQVQAQLYGTSTSGEAANLNPAANAAKTPSFLDTLGSDTAGAIASWASRPGSGGGSKV